MSDLTAGEGPGTHLDDDLSAYLDGELDEVAQQEAYRHLAACAMCQAELESVKRVRTLLRAAPEVEPPVGFIDRVLRDRRRRQVLPTVAGVLGIAAAWLVVVGVVVASERAKVMPPVADVAAARLARDVGGAGEVLQGPEIRFRSVAPGDVPAPFAAPESPVGGLELDGAFRAEGRNGWLLVYQDGDDFVTVYQQHGPPDLSALSGGSRLDVDGEPAWQGERGGQQAVVVPRGGMTYTIVGDRSASDLVEIARALPDQPDLPAPSIVERVERVCREFVDGFGFR